MLVRVTITGQYGGQRHVNVLHFQQADATSIQYFSLGVRVQDFWCGTHRGVIDATMKWENIHVEPRSTSSDPAYDFPTSLTGVLGPSVVYCPFLCACFLFHTNVPGRRGRGRTFQAGYGHGASYSAGQWQVATQNALDAAADALTGDWCTGASSVDGWRLCVAARDETLSGIDVIRISGRPKVSTMNTRKIGRGA